MNRREQRIKAMQLLYNADFNNITIEEAIKNVSEENKNSDIMNFLNMVNSNIDKIDELINKSIINYSLDRLNMVDKAIIRLAVAEMLSGTDKKVAINEALEITKEFSDQGDHKATSFNNKLLDNISKNI